MKNDRKTKKRLGVFGSQPFFILWDGLGYPGGNGKFYDLLGIRCNFFILFFYFHQQQLGDFYRKLALCGVDVSGVVKT